MKPIILLSHKSPLLKEVVHPIVLLIVLLKIFKSAHLRQRLAERETQYEDLSTKIKELRKQHALELDPGTRVQLGEKLRCLEDERDELEEKIDMIEAKLNG